MTRETAQRVLALADLDLGRLSRRAASREFTAVETGLTVHGGLRSRVRRIETRNVVGLRRGEERPGEVITLTTHYDHLGVGETV
ncbi:MAG: peptidase M28, partial [Gemmatimonadetes bacterium]|nr:peptidase M28 [Gemmatimonadota bacterium]NIR78214.1 peptidase M28 [Gemmatimonadota bacterium]NIT86942.1 peptidase M28 [Gemmatimonadota bacterium]NIU30659.1 peptidase M28 [Gemmatimonadota bacterium]NIU35463.1 peptidase M28 [Gemmatimonadota bacterium]